MKRKIGWVLAAALLVLLAAGGCAPKTHTAKNKPTPVKTEQKAETVPTYRVVADNNMDKFKQAHGQYRTINYDPQDDLVSLLPESLAKLKKYPQTTTVHAYVTDWQQAPAQPSGRLVTVLTVYVQKVLTGRKKLAKQELQLTLPGGFIPYGQFGKGAYDHDDTIPDAEVVLTQNNQVPIPTIGSTIVVPVTKLATQQWDKNYIAWMKQAKLTTAYVPVDDHSMIWRCNPQTKKLTTNNPLQEKWRTGDQIWNRKYQRITTQLEEQL